MLLCSFRAMVSTMNFTNLPKFQLDEELNGGLDYLNMHSSKHTAT